MKLHRDLKIAQKTAWQLAMRIRETWKDSSNPIAGPVKVGETYLGILERNQRESEKLLAGRGTVGKIAIAGVNDREPNQVETTVVEITD